MKKISFVFLMIIVVLSACTKKALEGKKEVWELEIAATEQQFSEMAVKEGIQKAFLHFAANDVVLSRGDRLIKGKDSLAVFYNYYNSTSDSISLTWKPDFIDVSNSGDLGYTYGKYIYAVTDSTGKTKTSEGIFHTVWKRQPDGSWRFVWD